MTLKDMKLFKNLIFPVLLSCRALACLHALADAGECEILATVSSTRGNASVAAIEVINAYYGRGDLPVGAPDANDNRRINFAVDGCRILAVGNSDPLTKVKKSDKEVKHGKNDT